jgi:hypothetical protein
MVTVTVRGHGQGHDILQDRTSKQLFDELRDSMPKHIAAAVVRLVVSTRSSREKKWSKASISHLEDIGPSCHYKIGMEHGDKKEVASNCNRNTSGATPSKHHFACYLVRKQITGCNNKNNSCS